MADLLPVSVAEEMAKDVAVGFFDEEQLCRRYALSAKQLSAIASQPAFLRQVDEQKKRLEEDGADFKLAAREEAVDMLRMLSALAKSDGVAGLTRVKAAKEVITAAGFDYLRPQKEGGQTVVPIQINTNLSMGQQPGGTYTIEAKSDEQVAAAHQPMPEYGGEGSDLL